MAKQLLIFLAAISIVVPAFFITTETAQADSWVISVGSKHVGSSEKYNEVNPGVGYLKDLHGNTEWYEPDYLTTGVYYNSIEKVSVYAGAGYKLFGPLSIELGAVTGYHYSVTPGLIGAIDLGKLRVVVLPPVPAVDAPLVFGFQVKL